MSVHDDYNALRNDVGAVAIDRDVIRISGPDAVDFLQGQVSQDIAALAIGQSALSFLLQPQGKVDALVRIVRVGDEEVLVDTDGGWGDSVVERLERFKLRVKADLSPVDLRAIAVRGPASNATHVPPGSIVVDAAWPGTTGFDLLGGEGEVPGTRPCGPVAFEVLRIEAGFPRMGSEIDQRTIPAETGLVDAAVSFTKGCFTGQELVARIDSRGGNVPRRLRGVVVEGGEQNPPEVGAELRIGDKIVGALTSVGWSPGIEAVVALAYVRRDVEPPADATVEGRVARIAPVPLVS